MGTDELTRIHELAKRVTLLEKMVLRQQSRIDELVQSIERAADNKNRPLSMRADATQSAGDRAAEENTTAVRAVSSVSDLLDEEMKHELTHAYTASPVQQQEPPWDRAASAMERAAGSYARATGGKEPMQSDRAKQNEAARRKIAEETLEQIPVHELRERTPAERASDYMRDYNALYDVPGTMFQKKRAQDDFIKLYQVLGLRCTNMQLRLSRPELEPRFVAVTPTRDADFLGNASRQQPFCRCAESVSRLRRRDAYGGRHARSIQFQLSRGEYLRSVYGQGNGDVPIRHDWKGVQERTA